MAFHSFLEKSRLLLFFITVFTGLVVVDSERLKYSTELLINMVSGLQNSCVNGGNNCKYYSAQCTNPRVRKDWNALTDQEKQNYLKAVLCLSQKPTLPAIHAKFPGTVNRFDDFVAVHSDQTPYIHFNGIFIVWHRYMTGVYEKALQDECGYNGTQPYWNTANDVDSGLPMSSYQVFNNKTGFGGNGAYVSHANAPNPFGVVGASGGGCVPGGPFGTGSNFTTHIGPSPNTSINNPRCLIRDFAQPTLAYCNHSSVKLVLSQPNYSNFTRYINDVPGLNFTSIHGKGHLGVGGQLGQMCDLFNAPADPIFYMHHANLDRIFWKWQLLNPVVRLCQVGGSVVPNDYTVAQGPPVTLNTMINMDVMGANKTMRDLLSTFTDTFCYVYDLDS